MILDMKSCIVRMKRVSNEAEITTVERIGSQDAWNVDTQRLKDCCIHVVSKEGNLIPFCAYNITAAVGTKLYR